MATFVEVPGAKGKVRHKALCRVWQGPKQVSKSKTFGTRSEAERWAAEVERSMQEEVQEKKMAGLRNDRKEFHHPLETIGDVQNIFHLAQAHISAIGRESFLLLSVNKLVEYFENRVQAGANGSEIELEAELLYSMFRYRDNLSDRRDANLVQIALTALRTRGVLQ